MFSVTVHFVFLFFMLSKIYCENGVCDTTVDNSDGTSVPLSNEIRAPLVATLDITSINNQLKQFIKETIESCYEEMLAKHVDEIIEEKLRNQSTDLDQKLQSMVQQKVQEVTNESPDTVAFYAVLTEFVSLGESQTVIFDDVYTNLGDSYNKYSGYFTAPVSGLYNFDCTFLEWGNALHLQMVVNNNEIGRGHGSSGDGSNTGSIHAIVNLNKNDVVRIRHFPGRSIESVHGDKWSSFSGHLIAQQKQ